MARGFNATKQVIPDAYDVSFLHNMKVQVPLATVSAARVILNSPFTLIFRETVHNHEIGIPIPIGAKADGGGIRPIEVDC